MQSDKHVSQAPAVNGTAGFSELINSEFMSLRGLGAGLSLMTELNYLQLGITETK